VKLAIVSAVGNDGATLTQVAQRHDGTRQQHWPWHRERKRKGLWSPDTGALFLHVGMVPAMELTLVEDRTQALPPSFGLSGGGPRRRQEPEYHLRARAA